MYDASANPPDWVFLGQNAMGGAALSSMLARGQRPALVVTREAKGTHANAVVEVAWSARLPVVFAPRHDVRQFTDQVEKTDAVVCCGWGRRIPADILHLPRRGWVNLHPGDLCCFAGSDPLGWAAALGAQYVTCTLHSMTGVIDSGRVLARARLRVGEHDGLALRLAAGTLLGNMAAKWLTSHPVTPQKRKPPGIRHRCPPRGLIPFIETEIMPVEVVRRVVRAFTPHPGVLVHHAHGVHRVILAPRARPTDGESAVHSLPCRDGVVPVEVIG